MEEIKWHHMSSDDVLHTVGSTDTGLSIEMASKRLLVNGENSIPGIKAVSPVKVFISQFKNVIVWILIIAGMISLITGELIDALVIFIIILLNTGIGFVQELSAGRSIASLQKMSKSLCSVLRDGQIAAIPAEFIVVGDIVLLQEGNSVPADARIIEASSLRCLESSLTGESEAVEKTDEAIDDLEIPLADRRCMVYSGTAVMSGSARVVVVSAGMDTELGKIALLLDEENVKTNTPLEKRMNVVGRNIALYSVLAIVLLFILGLVRDEPIYFLVMMSISLAVAAVPEGLPAVVTLALSRGVIRMSRKNALVRNLPAVEVLGSTSVICTDKTGTLTEGKMIVRVLYVAGRQFAVSGAGDFVTGSIVYPGLESKEIEKNYVDEIASVLVGSNCSRQYTEDGSLKLIGDPTECALLVAGIKAGVSVSNNDSEFPVLKINPFDSTRRMSSSVRSSADGSCRIFVHGAPEVLIEKCTHIYTPDGVRLMTSEDRMVIMQENESIASLSLRVLASAKGSLPADYGGGKESSALNAEAVEKGLVFVGLSGMHDPPRHGVKDAVRVCSDAGITVVMITGDHPRTALAIARETGITDNSSLVISGTELDAISQEDFLGRVKDFLVYARVSAAHKLRIVKAWKSSGAVVAMTGDGINDAPAIRGADIGIAMGKGGTDVTRSVADMVITDDNFTTIVTAVREGRGIFENIRKTLLYLLAGNLSELLLIAVCFVIGLPLPLLPVQLLLVNLVTDGVPALCLATDSLDADLMNAVPIASSASMFSGNFYKKMFLAAFLTTAVCMAVFMYTLRTGSEETARTAVFAVLVFTELFRSFGARSRTKSILKIPFFTNKPLVLIVVLSLVFQLLTHRMDVFMQFFKTTFLPLKTGLVLMLIGTIPLIIMEIMKSLYFNRKKI